MNILLDFLLNYKSQIAVFFIFYFPTIRFCVTIILSIIISVLRGSRKTRIAITHSVICFIICLILFIALVEDKNVDAFLLRVVNTFLGEGGMQRLFGVSESCTTFRDIFIEYLPNQLNYVDGIALVARDNGMYLSSLVDVLYRFTFGIVLYLLYWVLRFIMWIISLIFYPERRYIRRRKRGTWKYIKHEYRSIL